MDQWRHLFRFMRTSCTTLQVCVCGGGGGGGISTSKSSDYARPFTINEL
jgi:hypothetical protein